MMATVARTLLDFFRRHPTASVAFSGSTPARTRLYQAALARQVRAASADFVILGLRDELLETFQLNYPYDGFVISLSNQLPSDESPAN